MSTLRGDGRATRPIHRPNRGLVTHGRTILGAIHPNRGLAAPTQQGIGRAAFFERILNFRREAGTSLSESESDDNEQYLN